LDQLNDFFPQRSPVDQAAVIRRTFEDHDFQFTRFSGESLSGVGATVCKKLKADGKQRRKSIHKIGVFSRHNFKCSLDFGRSLVRDKEISMYVRVGRVTPCAPLGEQIESAARTE